MEFKNRPNKSYRIPIDRTHDKIIWESRSVAVNCVILVWKKYDFNPYILVSERGPKASDFNGFQNVIAGYLDWDETGFEAVLRETWEESGLNLLKLLKDNFINFGNYQEPWSVRSDPSQNRQNVSLRYGISVTLKGDNELPILTTNNNEVVGETVNPQWIRESDIHNFKWAFNHDKLIEDFIKHIIR